MTDYLIYLILGAVQGITEFLPISSSAHLLVLSDFLQGKPLPLAVNVAFHCGTLLAILLYFFKDWLGVAQDALELGTGKRKVTDSQFALLVVGSIPAAIAGLLLEDWIETHLHAPNVTIIPLILVGYLLWRSDARSPADRTSVGFREILLIGCAQALALIPGTSRSGATITAGRLCHLDRKSATRLSFMLGAPCTAGAVLLHVTDILESLHDANFVVGFLSSFGFGMLAIHSLLKIISRSGFFPFFVYRCCLAGILIWQRYG